MPRAKLREFVIGRSGSADISIDEPSISGRHCKFIVDGGDGVRVQDVGSANGTFHNGKRLDKEAASLEDGDVVSLGQFEMLFRSGVQKSPLRTGVTVVNLAEAEKPKRVSVNLQSLDPFRRGRDSGAAGLSPAVMVIVAVVVLAIVCLLFKLVL